MREALLGKRQKQYHQWLKENFNIGFPWDFLNIAHLKRFVYGLYLQFVQRIIFYNIKDLVTILFKRGE